MLLRHVQSVNYFGYLFPEDRPYLRTVSPAPGEALDEAGVEHLFSEPVAHDPSAGPGYLLSADGSVFLELDPATHFAIDGGAVRYDLPGLEPGARYRFELPPGYFRTEDGRGTPPVYDWDSLARPPYPQRSVHWFVAP